MVSYQFQISTFGNVLNAYAIGFQTFNDCGAWHCQAFPSHLYWENWVQSPRLRYGQPALVIMTLFGFCFSSCIALHVHAFCFFLSLFCHLLSQSHNSTVLKSA